MRMMQRCRLHEWYTILGTISICSIVHIQTNNEKSYFHICWLYIQIQNVLIYCNILWLYVFMIYPLSCMYYSQEYNGYTFKYEIDELQRISKYSLIHDWQIHWNFTEIKSHRILNMFSPWPYWIFKLSCYKIRLHNQKLVLKLTQKWHKNENL